MDHSLTQLYRGIDCKVQNYDEGRFILWHQFSSSTVNPDIVKDFTAEGGSIFILRPSKASQGHLIDFLSEFEKEKEVLFAANTWFRVQQKLKDGTKRFLAQHMGIEWEVMKEIDVYELHEVTEDLARISQNVQDICLQKRGCFAQAPRHPKGSPVSAPYHHGTTREPWNHYGTTMEPPWNQYGTTMEPPWNHHGTTREPWNHHVHMLRSSKRLSNCRRERSF
jgi:hypothetical protein